MDLSIVLGGRDDNYGGSFVERLSQAVSANLGALDESGLDYEMIVVDFNPIGANYLYQKLGELLSHGRVENVVVDNSVIREEGLSPLSYYEYFAKNVGCRSSSGELVFLTNSDIVMSRELIRSIGEELKNERRNEVFYRARYRGEIPLGSVASGETRLEDLHRLEFDDACVCGSCSGDATMLSKEVLFDVATGYNEGEAGHRTHLSQGSMDGEILWNVYRKGKTLKFLESPYYHITHGKQAQRDGCYVREPYTNKEDWGFAGYPRVRLNKNTIMIGGRV